MIIKKIQTVFYGSNAIDENDNIYVCGHAEFDDNGDTFIRHVDNNDKRKQLFKKIYRGRKHNLAIDMNDNVYGWGRNDLGQLGIENKNTISDPILIATSDTVKKVVCGPDHNAFIYKNKKIFMFGDNSRGQLGLGHFNNMYKPTPLKYNFKSIKFGLYHSIALDDDDVCYEWGTVYFRTISPTYSRPSSLKIKFIKIFCGANFSFGIDKENNLYSWGMNMYGQLLTGDVLNRDVPTKLILGVKFKNLFCNGNSYGHVFGVSVDNIIYAWGNNECGQLGLGHKGEIKKLKKTNFIMFKHLHTLIKTNIKKIYLMMKIPDVEFFF